MASMLSSPCPISRNFQWISLYGLPKTIITDRGSNFTSNLWQDLTKHLGFKLQHTTSYNPESNGLIERLNRTLKSALRATCIDHTWANSLPWIMLDLRSAPHEALHASPAKVVYGKTLRLSADVIPTNEEYHSIEDIRTSTEQLLPTRQTYAEAARKIFIPTHLRHSPFVYERIDNHRTPLSPIYKGPFPVLQRSHKAFQINKDGTPDWVSINWLKPAFIADNGSKPGEGLM